MYMASKMPEQYIEDVRQTFIAIDNNGDGRIQLNELRKAFDILNIQYDEKSLPQIVAQVDTNNNGFIDYTEFIASCMKAKIYLNETFIKEAFDYFDRVSFS